MTDPFVVVGGDAAGLSAASKYRREAPDRDVIVFEKGDWVSYAQCGMPYFVKGEVDDITDLLSLSPDAARERGIDLRRHHEATAVDPDAKTVTVRSEDGAFEQPYSDLLVATGARALSAPIPGTDLAGAFTLHSMDDTAALRAFLVGEREAEQIASVAYVDGEYVREYGARDPPETAAIVGGGYVGVEMAEAFSAHDLDVHLFQRPDRLLPPFGEATGDLVAEELCDHGVAVHLGTEVEALTGEAGVLAGVEYDGGRLDADVAVVGIGVRPNTGFLDGSGVESGDSLAVAIDDYGRTSCEGVYAAGDCAEMRNAVTGDAEWVPLGLTANRAGRAIGQTVAGDPTPVGDIAGTAAVKAFELECGRTGVLDHERARDAGFDPVSRTITAGSRSGYYPGNADTTVTLTADRETGRLLGGSVVGEDRAAVRIDTVATALESDLTVPDVERLDLAYAPPFSPVWDPVLVAAKVLAGDLDGE